MKKNTRHFFDHSEESFCVICGATSGNIVHYERQCAAFQCKCGAIFAVIPSNIKSIYDISEIHQSSYYEIPANIRIKYLQRFRRGGRLLEVGSGDGHFLKAARLAGYQAHGLEADPARATRSRTICNLTVDEGFIEQPPPQLGRFEIIYHCDMLSHFPNPRLALLNMASLLRPGGILFFEVGLVAGLHPFWYRWMGTLRMPQHRWFYTPDAIAALLDDCNLELVHMKRFGLAPALLLSRIGKCLGIGGGATRHLSDDAGAARAPEAFWRQRLRVWLRYRFGPLVVGIGPETAFVIAQPRMHSEKWS